MTTLVSAEINSSDVPLIEALLKKIKAKSITFSEKDPTKMSKEEFFAKIDRARAGKKIRISREDMRKMLLSE